MCVRESDSVCVCERGSRACVCVCVRERERERESLRQRVVDVAVCDEDAHGLRRVDPCCHLCVCVRE